MLFQAICVGLIVMFGKLDWSLGMCNFDRPIVLCPLVGLALGDLSQGIVVGIALELLFLGNIAIGAAATPDVIVGGVMGCAFSIQMNMGAEMALAIALPVAIFSSILGNTLFQSVINVAFAHLADQRAEKGDCHGVAAMHVIAGMIRVISFGVLAGSLFFAGQDVIEGLVDLIPQSVIDGFNVVAGILPALGFALLIRLMVNKKVAPFLFLGYLMAAYLGVPVIGVSAFGVIAALVLIMNQKKTAAVATVDDGGALDDF